MRAIAEILIELHNWLFDGARHAPRWLQRMAGITEQPSMSNQVSPAHQTIVLHEGQWHLFAMTREGVEKYSGVKAFDLLQDAVREWPNAAIRLPNAKKSFPAPTCAVCGKCVEEVESYRDAVGRVLKIKYPDEVAA